MGHSVKAEQHTFVRGAHGVGIALGVSAAAVCVWVVALLGVVRVSVWLTPRPAPRMHMRLASLAPGSPIPMDTALHGRDVFERTCALCHSSSGVGRAGLGKDLVRSDFVADAADDALVRLIDQGRAADDPLNTTKVAMPPRGGVDTLTAADMQAVVHYIRGLQDPRRMPELPQWVPPPTVISEQDKQAALAAAGGDAELANYIASGDKLFHSTCVACHGKGGIGVKGNGKALAANEFIRSLDDDSLLNFIRQGRAPSDPKNTTGIQMPPKGGNPALSDDDLLDIISYLRTLQTGAATAATSK